MKFIQRLLFSLIGYSLVFWQLNMRFNDIFGKLLQGSFVINGSFGAYFILAILLSTINSLIKPLLMLLSLPLRWITLGAFSLVINASLLWLLQRLANFFSDDVTLHIEHWQTYIVVGLILSFVNGIIHWFEK
jgi:uncharacterized membrane protein YvlD (DUF360 family)